jgi:hypothetical protein
MSFSIENSDRRRTPSHGGLSNITLSRIVGPQTGAQAPAASRACDNSPQRRQ